MRELTDVIAHYERAALDLPTACAPAPDPAAVGVDGWLRIRGISAFWRAPGAGAYTQRATDLLVGSQDAATDAGLALLMTGTPQGIAIYARVPPRASAASLLRSAYPGVHLEQDSPAAAWVRTRGAYGGVITGIPAPPALSAHDPGDRADQTGPLERVMRGMRDATWLYLVTAAPTPRAEVVARRQRLHALRDAIAPLIRRQKRDDVEFTVEERDTTAEHAMVILDLELQRVDQALALGQWDVTVHFGADDPAAARRLAALLTGALSGPDSRPEHVRAIHRMESMSPTPGLTTQLNARELAALTQLPREEAPGYAVTDFTTFDCDAEPPAAAPDHCLTLGEIQYDGDGCGLDLTIPIDAIKKHVLLSGVPGSGKTSTARWMLQSLPTPYLLLEPAKTEYRTLLHTDPRGGGAVAPRIYTLGNEDVAPFRLNPFEFDLTPIDPYGQDPSPEGRDDGDGPSMLLSHIAAVKAAFNAAFILYAPMPYVLETALHEVYEDKGWVLATGRNIRLPQGGRRHSDYPIFPTLSDLYRKVEAITRRLNYEERIERDVIAGLRARIDALRVGAKGMMLDVPRGNPFAELLAYPTVLELESIGDDSEKVFIMGLILARLCEFRRLQAARGLPGDVGLQHLLVIEEAHRLLQRTDTTPGVESSNFRAQGVEMFVNILSEMRRYGQGVAVIEPVISKLVPDALKVTSLKIIHRLLAADDRAALAGAMNMSDEQSRHLTTLRPGYAVAFSEGDDHPYLIKAPTPPRRDTEPTDANVARWVNEQGYVKLGRYLLARDLDRLGFATDRFDAPKTEVYQRASRFATVDTDQAAWTRLIIKAAYVPSAARGQLDALGRRFHNSRHRLDAGDDAIAFRLAVVLGVAHALQERAADGGWPYAATDDLHRILAEALLDTLDGAPRGAHGLAQFADAYRDVARHTSRPGPYPGCAACAARCRYRGDVTRMLTAETIARVQTTWTRCFGGPKFPAEKQARWVRDLVATVWLEGSSEADAPPAVASTQAEADLDGLAYCAGLTAFAHFAGDAKQAAYGTALAAAIRPAARPPGP